MPTNAKPSLESRAAVSNDDMPVTVLEPRSGWQLVDWGDLWKYRELLVFLAWRDIKVRYKQTVLGATWAILQPFATMVVFTFFFAKRSGVESNYPVYTFAALVPWYFFANSLMWASQSIVTNQNLVTKVYFPRLIIPLAAVGAGLVDLAISFSMMLVIMVIYGITPSSASFFAIVPLVLLLVAALGAGTWLSALTVAYRDFRYVVPFMVQFGLFMTPNIFFNSNEMGERSQWLLPLNPAYGLIENFRAALLGTPFDYYALSVSGAVSVALLVLGSFYFRRVEQSFADVI